MLKSQPIVGLRVEFESVCFAAGQSVSMRALNMAGLRDYQAVFLWGQEVELESVADAARPVDGCNVGHIRLVSSVQLLVSRSTKSSGKWCCSSASSCSDVFRHDGTDARSRCGAGNRRQQLLGTLNFLAESLSLVATALL
jgi:hypothetical protein